MLGSHLVLVALYKVNGLTFTPVLKYGHYFFFSFLSWSHYTCGLHLVFSKALRIGDTKYIFLCSVGLVSFCWNTLGASEWGFHYYYLILVGQGYLMVFIFLNYSSLYIHARTFIPRQNHRNINMIWNGINPSNILGT